jgi:hypothetical protein
VRRSEAEGSAMAVIDRLLRVLPVVGVSPVIFVFVAVHVVIPRMHINHNDTTVVNRFMYLYAFSGLSFLAISLYAKRLREAGNLKCAIPLIRILIIIAAATAGAIVALTLTFTSTFRAMSEWCVQRWPYLLHIGSEVLAKILDWVAGGLVFEAVRRSFNRFVKKAERRNPTG